MTNTEARSNAETVKRGVESACLILLYISLYRFYTAKTGHFPQIAILYFLFVVVSDSFFGGWGVRVSKWMWMCCFFEPTSAISKQTVTTLKMPFQFFFMSVSDSHKHIIT